MSLAHYAPFSEDLALLLEGRWPGAGEAQFPAQGQKPFEPIGTNSRPCFRRDRSTAVLPETSTLCASSHSWPTTPPRRLREVLPARFRTRFEWGTKFMWPAGTLLPCIDEALLLRGLKRCRVVSQQRKPSATVSDASTFWHGRISSRKQMLQQVYEENLQGN